jgi:hypothetical protein
MQVTMARYFTPVVAMPWMKQRWKKINTRSMGRIETPVPDDLIKLSNPSQLNQTHNLWFCFVSFRIMSL